MDIEMSGNVYLNEYKFVEHEKFKRFVSAEIYDSIPGGKLNPNNITVTRKKFLRKNKKRIMTEDFISRFSPKELFFGYLGVTTTKTHKVIYIIDEESLKRKDKHIVLRKATVLGWTYTQI
ncbi:hypothetical protein ACLI1A_03985 [Flavobacterium sp. RHBU_3]|uniref:hypothetical protein n=1 Tax=Flavobacterium sp. RHBU_3 TaxID=3391184 RepID=UPI003984CF1C